MNTTFELIFFVFLNASWNIVCELINLINLFAQENDVNGLVNQEVVEGEVNLEGKSFGK